MVGRKLYKHEAGSGDASTADNSTNSNVRFRVINTNLKNAINNCRNLLQSEIRATNLAMREKIQEWLMIDATNISFNVAYNKDMPLAHENETMRQILSDLVHGPLGSLLPNEERRKLVKLVIPTLPNGNSPYYDDLRDVDFFQTYESQTSLYNGRGNDYGGTANQNLGCESITTAVAATNEADDDSKSGITFSSSNETIVSAAQYHARYMRN